MTPLPLPPGWSAANTTGGLLVELSRELPPGHRLSGIPLRLLAYCQDDLLVQPIANPRRFIVVHLTWSAKPETNPDFPAIDYDGDWVGFIDYERQLNESEP